MRIILSLFNKIYNNGNYLLFFIIFLSVIFSLVFLIFFKNIGPIEHQIPGGDYFDRYEPIANNILQGKGLMFRGRVSSFTAPGFPIVLAGIFGLSQAVGIDKFDLIVVFNVIFTALAALFLFLIAKEIFNKKIGLIASLLWMTYPFNLWFIKNPNSEVPFVLLLYLAIFLYLLAIKKSDFKLTFLAGFFLGLASFFRITSFFLPFFLGLLLLFLIGGAKKGRVFLMIILLAGSFFAITPWVTYGILKTGSFLSLSTEGPHTIVVGIIGLSTIKAGGEDLVLSEDVRMLIERVELADLDSGEKLFGFFAQELVNRPAPLLKLIGLKLARSWYATSQQWWEDRILAVQSLYMISAAAGLILAMKISKKRKIKNLILPLVVISYFWGMTFLSISFLRYLIPAMGLVVIFSAVFINFLIEKLTKRRPSLL